MFGEWWLILPDTQRKVRTRPWTLPVVSFTTSNHEVICDVLFFNNKYSEINLASAMLSIFDNTPSSTIGEPLSVNLFGFQPNFISRSAICLRDARLNSW